MNTSNHNEQPVSAPPLRIWVPFILLILSSTQIFAAPQIAWTARHAFGTNSDSKVFAVALDPRQNLIVAGTSKNDLGNTDYITAKYSPAGSNLWMRRFDSGANDQVRGLALDGEANVLITGTSTTVKYGGADGVEQWTAPYGGRGVAIDGSNNVVVTGFSEDDFATVKLNPQGSNIWTRTYDRIGRQDISQVVGVDTNGNVFVAGIGTYQCAAPTFCYFDFYVAKYDAGGSLQWMVTPKLQGLSALSELVGLNVDKRGNVTIAGNCMGTAKFKYYTAKFSPMGDFMWSSYYHPTDGEGLRAMVLDAEDNLYLTGGLFGRLDERVYYKTFKIGVDGGNAWEGTYSYPPGASFNRAQAIALDSTTNVYVTGQSTGESAGSDWATIKYSPSGQEQWVVRYDGPAHGEDQATAIAVDNSGAIYVGGFVTTTNGIEMLLIKYVELQSIQVQTNQNVLLQFFSAPGVSNRVQATINFSDWLELGFSLADTNGLIHFLDTNASNYPFRFYRTVTP